MRNILIALPLLFVIYFSVSCGLVLEKDLKSAHITINSPADNDTLRLNTITFWWDDVEAATSYEFQIVKPSFDHVTQLIIDTNLTDNKFTINLNPGVYQWRIRAKNNNTSSAFNTRTLYIISPDSLSSSNIVLKSPADNSYNKTGNVTCKWYTLSGATYYTFQLIDGSGATVYNNNLSTDSVLLNSLPEGTYQWKVRANNDVSSTAFSSRTFSVDYTNPNTPSLNSPFHADSVNNPFTLSWSRGLESGSPITDSLFIYSDSLSTLINTYTSTTTSYSLSGFAAGRYYWRVRSIDAAGNVSAYSSTRKFYVR